ncbi:MAG: hypothetical protein ABGY72_13195 [bacterium]
MEASSGAEALRLSVEAKPRLVVAGDGLGVPDAGGLAARIRAAHLYSDVRVVAHLPTHG